MIYLDSAATTYPKPDEVHEAVNYGLKTYSFNSGRGSYKAAFSTFKMIEETREKIGAFVGVKKECVIFTSSATESLNNIIYGLDLKKGDVVFVSPFEHNSVIRPLMNCGVDIKIIPFDKKWNLDESKFNDMMVLYSAKAVIISHISNVTGFELPYKSIFKMAKEKNIITVLDAAQSFGVYNIDPEFSDIIVFAGHKALYAITGIAGFILCNDIDLKVYKSGGTGSDTLNPKMPEQIPYKYEAGSLNSVGIYTINKSIDFLKTSDFDKIKSSLVSYLLDRLRNFGDNIIIYAPHDYLPRGIVSFNIKGFSSDDIGAILSEEFDICVRTGYHCAPYVHDFISSKEYNGTVRVSFSGFNTKEDVDSLIKALKLIVGDSL